MAWPDEQFFLLFFMLPVEAPATWSFFWSFSLRPCAHRTFWCAQGLCENDEKKNLLTPKLSLRYSPNDTKNLKDETRLLTSDNIFSSNRIGFGETIESGGSLTLGLDYEQKSKTSDETFFQSKTLIFDQTIT